VVAPVHHHAGRAEAGAGHHFRVSLGWLLPISASGSGVGLAWRWRRRRRKRGGVRVYEFIGDGEVGETGPCSG
jgi:transketolase N-terminal domain/subunit